MNRRKGKKQSAKATLGEVTKEIAKPRVIKSEESGVRLPLTETLIVENNVEK